ncbi:HAD family hydrolase [Micrococcus endophyticus]|uniref:HAD family hydrolase n=1 Tax=Micrococcus endophyticus TaxID=455343 RepID=UPI002004AF54
MSGAHATGQARTTAAGGSPSSPAPAFPEWDAVLFDLDDTLLDLRAAQHAAFGATVRRQWAGAADVDPARMAAATEAFASDAAGHYERYVAGELTFEQQRLARAADALRALGAPEESATPLEALWTADYEDVVRGHWALFPATAEVLAQVRSSGRGVGIVTNNVEAYQRAKADALGLDWVDVLIGSDTAGAPKPDPEPFLAGCARLGAEPGRTLMVGDSLTHDVAGARAAGLVPVWMSPAAPARGAAEDPVWDPERGCWRLRAIGGLRAWLRR